MKEDSKVVEEFAELGLGVEEILRQGARRLVQDAVEAELSAVLDELGATHLKRRGTWKRGALC